MSISDAEIHYANHTDPGAVPTGSQRRPQPQQQVFTSSLFRQLELPNEYRHTVCCLGSCVSFTVCAHGSKALTTGTMQEIDTPAAQVVVNFHQALKSENRQQARALLANDVTINEGGNVERSADEYQQHHMAADMAYLADMQVTTPEHQVNIDGNTANSISHNHTKGMYKGKARDQQGMETNILQLQNGQWKIKHIHWS